MIEIMVITAVLTGLAIAIVTELARVGLYSQLDTYNYKNFLQPAYDVIKIGLKKDKPHFLVRIAVVLKIVIMLVIFSFLPVLFTYPAIEPRYHYVLIILLLMTLPVLDLLIDRIKRDETGLFSWINYGRSNLILLVIFAVSIMGKILLESINDINFPDSIGFPILFSVENTLSGVYHVTFGIVAVLVISLYNYRLDSIKKPPFTSTPGIPANWLVNFTGKYLALDIISSILHRFSLLILVIHFFVSPLNSESVQLSIDSIGLQGVLTGAIINITAFIAIIICTSLVNTRIFKNQGLRKRERFSMIILIPVIVITYLFMIIFPFLAMNTS